MRLSTRATESAELLSHLIESHRYSHGMSIVPQGAPTNNTDAATSGLTTAHENVDETYGLELDATPFPVSSAPMAQLDGERLASVLGVPIDAVRALPNARRADIAESVAMNRALWNATLGHFVTEMLEGTFAAADVAKVRTFLTEFVHGRGLAPAIRIGAQPYGIVITSSFDDWQWSEVEHGDDGDFWDRLRNELGFLRGHWQTVVEKEVFHVGKRDAKGILLDPFKTLINIIGLQASSVEFWSRTGVPQSYFKALAAYADNDPELVTEWIVAATNMRSIELFAARLPHNNTASIRKVLFMEKAERVTMALVDGDPTLPLSEVRTIRPFDGVPAHNYIYWLATASSADIQYQNFRRRRRQAGSCAGRTPVQTPARRGDRRSHDVEPPAHGACPRRRVRRRAGDRRCAERRRPGVDARALRHGGHGEDWRDASQHDDRRLSAGSRALRDRGRAEAAGSRRPDHAHRGIAGPR